MTWMSEGRIVALAELARLELTAEESARFSGQIEAVLSAFQSLAQVSVEGVEPLYHPGHSQMVLREDSPRDSDSERLGVGAFRVPPVL
jgi:aspartyl-tRNA(Asn)/glutamyl-tRNA(Gln) amidotransferase subunit C